MGLCVIVFDLITLTVADLTLARLVCNAYYRRVFDGRPVRCRSCDIPGITTFLLDHFLLPPNLIALAIKLLLFAIIVIVDVNIETTRYVGSNHINRNSTYEFNASSALWSHIPESRFAALTLATRACFEWNKKRDTLTYYHIAFNTGYRVDDTIPGVPNVKEVLFNSVQCLSPSNVIEDDVRPLLHVVNCSKLVPSTVNCSSEEVVRVRWTPTLLIQEWGELEIYMEYKFYNATFNVVGEDEVRSIFPVLTSSPSSVQYSNSSMTCIRVFQGIEYERTDRISCLLVVFRGNNTVIDRWEYSVKDKTLQSQSPGPEMGGRLDIGLEVIVTMLLKDGSNWNWVSGSGLLLSRAITHRFLRPDEQTITVRQEGKLETSLPTWVFALACAMVGTCLMSGMLVAWLNRKDGRPRINSIEGLSSIAREEKEPSGRSLMKGPPVSLGLSVSSKGGEIGRFGALRYGEAGVKRTEISKME